MKIGKSFAAIVKGKICGEIIVLSQKGEQKPLAYGLTENVICVTGGYSIETIVAYERFIW